MKKWTYSLDASDDDTSSQTPPQIFINQKGGGESGPGIRVVENTVYFYSEVDDSSALLLNQILFELDCKLQNAKSFFGPNFVPHIKLKICSQGGSLFSALAIIDTIRGLKAEVHTYIEGSAASAATLISVSGKKRYIGKNSHMLIHQLGGGVSGTYAEIEDNMENCKKFMKLIKDIYKQYTKISMKQIDEVLKHDLWFDAAMCLELGMVDEVL